MPLNRTKKDKGFLFSLLGFGIITAVWWLLAATTFKQNGVIPSPPETLKLIGREMRKDTFFKAVSRTLVQAFVSFVISFGAAAILALAAHYKKFIGNIINPFIVLFRAMPTMALVLILLLTVGSNLLPAVVAFLVVFPLCYENMRAAISEVDQNLVRMARIFKVPRARQLTGIYLPAMLPYVFSSLIAGFGLNIKVVISAEVMGLPSMSIGYLMLAAKQSFDFGLTFAWLVIAVLLSLLCETILRIVKRLCMPYRYPDWKIVKTGFNKIFKKRSNIPVSEGSAPNDCI
ncbi:MAG: ABC transporter permease subunit [Firmicutes bacterium]|nr:ABC transporter permease subunit [Bacillota bacterium]